jgi:hypothetical protein
VTLLVPAQPGVAAPTTGVPDPDPSARLLWRRAWQRSVLVPLTVLAPLVALAPTADHRFNLYWHGGLFRDHPLRIVPHTLDSVGGYLTLGNFRPLGRMVEKSLDLLAYTLADLAGVPVTIPFRLVSFAAAAVLTVAATLLAESIVARGPLFSRAPSTLAATVPFATGAGLIAAGSASPAVLFGGLYLLSAALVLTVAAAACRTTRRIGWWRGAALVAAGTALASFNEIAYLALPFATAAVAIRHRAVLRDRWRSIATSPAARALGLLWLGFLPVFGAVRLIIRAHCAAGSCYRGSALAAGPAVIAAVPARMVAWFPVLAWYSATQDAHRPWVPGAVAMLALLVLGTLAWRAVRDLPRHAPVGRRAAYGLAAAAGVLLLLGATLGSLNADVQNLVALHRWGQGWRDSAVTAVAGGIALTAVVLARSGPRRRAGLVVVLALAATVSTAANKTYRDQLAGREPALLANRIAGEMADFDRTAAGDARRCALRAEFRALYADSAFSLKRFDQSLDVAAEQQAARRFCEAAR